jgi:hypothetical protein
MKAVTDDLNQQVWPFQYNLIYQAACQPQPYPTIFPTHHLIVGGVAGLPGHFGFPLSGFLRVRKEVNLHIRVWVIPIL